MVDKSDQLGVRRLNGVIGGNVRDLCHPRGPRFKLLLNALRHERLPQVLVLRLVAPEVLLATRLQFAHYAVGSDQADSCQLGRPKLEKRTVPGHDCEQVHLEGDCQGVVGGSGGALMLGESLCDLVEPLEEREWSLSGEGKVKRGQHECLDFDEVALPNKLALALVDGLDHGRVPRVEVLLHLRGQNCRNDGELAHRVTEGLAAAG